MAPQKWWQQRWRQMTACEFYCRWKKSRCVNLGSRKKLWKPAIGETNWSTIDGNTLQKRKPRDDFDKAAKRQSIRLEYLKRKKMLTGNRWGAPHFNTELNRHRKRRLWNLFCCPKEAGMFPTSGHFLVGWRSSWCCSRKKDWNSAFQSSKFDPFSQPLSASPSSTCPRRKKVG